MQILKKILYYIALGVSHLPLRVLYVFADIIRPFVSGYRRKIVKKNIDNAFPEKTEAERKKIVRQFYHHLCDVIAETLKMMSISKEEMKRRMVFEGVKEMEDLLDDHPFVFIYLGHYCNWEWFSSMPMWSDRCYPGQVYKPLRDKWMDELFLKMRSRFGGNCMDKNKILRIVMQLKSEKKPTIIGFISDQTPKWDSIHDWVDFLHQDTPVFTGTERLARKVDAAIVFGDVERVKRGYYKCTLRKMCTDVKALPEYALTEMYMKEMERMIRRQPQFWLWTHNRWKRQRNDGEAANA